MTNTTTLTRLTHSTDRALDNDLGVVLAAHGSARSCGSGAPVYEHARRLRRRPLFDDVRVAFWQEEPSFSEILGSTTSTQTFVVPFFVSEGYFTRTVLPRELTARSDLDDDSVTITEPVGTAPAVTDLLRSRATDAVASDRCRSEIGLAVVAHGAENDSRSALAAKEHVDRLQRRAPSLEATAVYLEEPPYVSEALDELDRHVVVAVPLFVGKGGHVTSDVPQLLGLDSDDRVDDETVAVLGGETNGQLVRYTDPIGTHSALTDVAVRRVLEAATGVGQS